MAKEKEETEGELVIVPEKDKANASVEIVPFGTNDRIRLSAAIVRQMIATPTKSGKQPDDNQCIKFIMLCKARHLNPFEGDAYMVGYDAVSGPQFSLITAHQVFLKRAEASKGFNGMESGVIVQMKDTPPQPVISTVYPSNMHGGVIEREGDLVMDDERLIGGWAKVYRKDREKPFYRRLKLSTFNTGKSRWEKDPAGMIVKCAEADALRTAFPSHLGGLYIDEELPPIDVTPTIQRAQVPKDLSASVLTESPPAKIGSDEVLESAKKSLRGSSGNASNQEPDSSGGQKLVRKKKEVVPQNQKEILAMLNMGGYTPVQLMEVARAQGWCEDDETWPLPEEKIAVFLREDNWKIIMEELDALPKHSKD
jgi:phage recombination protein Bet